MCKITLRILTILEFHKIIELKFYPWFVLYI